MNPGVGFCYLFSTCICMGLYQLYKCQKVPDGKFTILNSVVMLPDTHMLSNQCNYYPKLQKSQNYVAKTLMMTL